MDYELNKENITSETEEKIIYSFVNELGVAIHRSKIIDLKNSKIISYPYTFNKDNILKKKKINTIEFESITKIEEIPNQFKNKYGKIDFIGNRAKPLFSRITKLFPKVTKVIISSDKNTRFYTNTITLNLTDLETVLKTIGKEKSIATERRKLNIDKQLSAITTKVTAPDYALKGNDLSRFLSLYKTYKKLSANDLDSVSNIIAKLPATQISITENFIKTSKRINIFQLEDIIKTFESHMKTKNKNEKEWQKFFNEHGWILPSLLPFEVILYKKEAFVGGKTMKNEEGRLVDFLFETGYKDNYAMLEIKTHCTGLLKSNPYREPAAYAMTDEFSGSISQCIDQKNEIITNFGRNENIFDPKIILIIGQKSKLNDTQRSCFELIRGNQKNVEIITFDELLNKLKGLLKILNTDFK